jgi:hypothetical protein
VTSGFCALHWADILDEDNINDNRGDPGSPCSGWRYPRNGTDNVAFMGASAKCIFGSGSLQECLRGCGV